MIKEGEATVSMSLKEFTDLQEKQERDLAEILSQNHMLTEQNKALEKALSRLGIPSEVINRISKDIPLTCMWEDDPERLCRKFHITFEVPISNLFRE